MKHLDAIYMDIDETFEIYYCNICVKTYATSYIDKTLATSV
jgi:hypothetical protein